MKRRIEIIFKNYTRLVITTERNILERDNRFEIFDIEEHKMFFINIDEIIYYTIKLLNKGENEEKERNKKNENN